MLEFGPDDPRIQMRPTWNYNEIISIAPLILQELILHPLPFQPFVFSTGFRLPDRDACPIAPELQIKRQAICSA